MPSKPAPTTSSSAARLPRHLTPWLPWRPLTLSWCQSDLGCGVDSAARLALMVIGWQCRKAFPRISSAMDGRREAHMDVLVAVFGKAFLHCHSRNPERLGPGA